MTANDIGATVNGAEVFVHAVFLVAIKVGCRGEFQPPPSSSKAAVPNKGEASTCTAALSGRAASADVAVARRVAGFC